jgi:hypothetical protein
LHCEPATIDVSKWLHQHAPTNQQSQALIAHFVQTILPLTLKQRKMLARTLGIVKSRQGLLYDIVGHCLGVAPLLVYMVWSEKGHWVGGQGWAPVDPDGECVDPADDRECGQGGENAAAGDGGIFDEVDLHCDKATEMKRNCVREAIAQAVEGNSYSSYERQMVRNVLAHANVAQRLGSRRQAQEFVNLGALVMQMLDAEDINKILPGIGVPSQYGVTFDGVPIGCAKMSSHDELMVVCLYVVSPYTFMPHSPMLAAPAMPFDGKTGAGTLRTVNDVLRTHPAGLDTTTSSKRGAGVGGDGAVAAGGVDHRHKSNKAAESLWEEWHPQNSQGSVPLCSSWDVFHQADLGFWRAARAVPFVKEIFDVGKQIQNMFGFGRGMVLMRSIGALGPAEDRPKNIAVGGSTRKVGHLSVVPANQIHNLPTIVKACGLELHTHKNVARGKGKGAALMTWRT